MTWANYPNATGHLMVTMKDALGSVETCHHDLAYAQKSGNDEYLSGSLRPAWTVTATGRGCPFSRTQISTDDFAGSWRGAPPYAKFQKLTA